MSFSTLWVVLPTTFLITMDLQAYKFKREKITSNV